MKAKNTVPREGELPDPPVEMVDVPVAPPSISQAELVACENALLRYQVARADYETKRAGLTLKLLQGCRPDPGDVSASLDGEDPRLVLRDANTA
jgi:hypothetical protein